MSTNAARTAIIAGGGIGGLAVAWALARYGWQVRVHERSPEIREIGAGILLMNNSISIFEHYGFADLILSDAVAYEGSLRLEHDGRLIQRSDLRGEYRWMGVTRSALVLGLAEAARRQGVEIITDSEAVDIDPGGTLTLANGTVEQADLVIAADGFRSKLRDQLGLTVRASDRRSGATRLLIKRTDAESEPIFREYWSGRRRVGIGPVASDLTYTYLSCPHSDARGCAMPIDIESWRGEFPGIPEFFDRVAEPLGIARHSYAHAVVRKWSNGRAAVLGDAAHAFPPALGQGAGIAIANGYALARVLDGEPDIAVALQQWEQRFRWVADQTQRWSLRIDSLTTQWPRPLSLVRRAMLWGIGQLSAMNSRVRVADRIDLAGPKFDQPGSHAP